MAKRIRLLVVDDEVKFVTNLARRLSLRDFAVESATSGEEALLKARRQEFDLVLLDLRMPGLGGEEVLEILKKDQPLTEVVILTGHGSIESAVSCTKAGSYGYLQKPCELDELLMALRDAYERRIQRKYQLGKTELRERLGFALVGAPLQALLRLRDADEKGL